MNNKSEPLTWRFWVAAVIAFIVLFALPLAYAVWSDDQPATNDTRQLER
jgi:hypothetical protein